MFEDYVAGFFDGEGSLIIRFIPDKRYKSGFQIREHINITQKDLQILHLIQNRLSMGRIHFHKRDKIWYLNIYKIQDILRFVNVIKGRLVVKKDKLERFETCMKIIESKEHLTPQGLQKLKMIWLTPETELNTL